MSDVTLQKQQDPRIQEGKKQNGGYIRRTASLICELEIDNKSRVCTGVEVHNVPMMCVSCMRHSRIFQTS